jgi:enoyl-CoA hydratase
VGHEAHVSVRVELPDGHPHVAVVTIDRPEAANALDPPTLRELASAWRRIAGDPGIRCAILTGAGERVFCAGMDVRTTIPASQRLARGERLDDETFAAMRDVGTATLVDFDVGVPLVCAVNGHARAGGFDLMLASDIRFAVPQATFALEEVALGLYPTGHATVLLPRQVPWVHAQALLLTGRPIDAERARDIGRATWRGVRELVALPLPEAYRRQEELGRPLRKTDDAREAQRAFVEKRRPVWRGR